MALFPIFNVKEIQMKEVIAAMLQLQDKLNARTIGPDWATKGTQDWCLAISQECAEGIDCIGWKWWAKQNPHLQAARMEVIDVLHFVLSEELRGAEDAPTDVIAARLTESYNARFSPVFLDEAEFDVASAAPVQLFQLISGLACVGTTNIGLVFLLAEKLGVKAEHVTILYRQKATLNLFRQSNGYKEGSYIKHWAPGLEDNTFLETLSQGINWSHATAQDLFYGRLNVKYLELTQAMQKH